MLQTGYSYNNDNNKLMDLIEKLNTFIAMDKNNVHKVHELYYFVAEKYYGPLHKKNRNTNTLEAFSNFLKNGSTLHSLTDSRNYKPNLSIKRIEEPTSYMPQAPSVSLYDKYLYPKNDKKTD